MSSRLGRRKASAIAWTLAVLVIVLVYGSVYGRNTMGAQAIRLSGNIEVTDTEVSSRIPGRLAARLVDEGEHVDAGQEVARLETAELEKQVALRKADVQVAEAIVWELEAGSRPQEIELAEAAVRGAQAALDEVIAWSRPQELAVANSEVAWARAEAERFTKDFERYSMLFASNSISQQKLEASRTAMEVANAHLKALQEKYSLVKEGARKEKIEQVRAVLQQAEERRKLAVEGPRKEAIEQARAKLEQAKAALALSEVQCGYAKLVSPIGGIVLSKGAENGEFVSPGLPIITVGDITHTWLRAYISERDLARVKIGQRVDITTDTYPGKTYAGQVVFIASQAEFTPKNVQTDIERVKLVYRVKIDIPNPELELKPGMPADGVIHTQ